MANTFPMGPQWVAGLSTAGEARSDVPGQPRSWAQYLTRGENALNFSGGDRVRLDTSPPAELVAGVASGRIAPPVWTIEVKGGLPWTIGPADEHGDPEEAGGEGIPLSQVPAAYRETRPARGFCITLKPDKRNPLGRFVAQVSVRCGDYVGVDAITGEPFTLVAWA